MRNKSKILLEKTYYDNYYLENKEVKPHKFYIFLRKYTLKETPSGRRCIFQKKDVAKVRGRKELAKFVKDLKPLPLDIDNSMPYIPPKFLRLRDKQNLLNTQKTY